MDDYEPAPHLNTEGGEISVSVVDPAHVEYQPVSSQLVVVIIFINIVRGGKHPAGYSTVYLLDAVKVYSGGALPDRGDQLIVRNYSGRQVEGFESYLGGLVQTVEHQHQILVGEHGVGRH